MIRRPNKLRLLAAPVVLLTAFMLAGCKTEGVTPYNAKANAPIPPPLLATMQEKSMGKESPMLVRLFKEEAELEVWKQDATGRYALLKTYPICRWSGDLGPKKKEGDRQAPEGFYDITPAQMNPKSSYYLAFNLGYPNAFDRAHDRTGAHLMVHGDCSSRGCYAMSDEQISEIFAMGREAFFGGQKSFQVQAYPFRMTPANLAKHRNSPHYEFWKMLKRGNDNFMVTRMEPKVDVCEGRYVFNAQTNENFSPRGKCPAFEVPQDVLAAVHDKQRRDELKIAQLVAQHIPTVPKSNRDGGMHPSFIAALQPKEVVDERGKIRLVIEKDALESTKVASVAYSPAVEETRSANNAPDATTGERPAEPTFAEKLGALFRTASAPSTPAPAAVAAAQPEPKPQDSSRSASLFNRIATPRPRPELETAETPKKESIATRVSRAIGLRGSEKPQPEAEQKPAQAAPGAIRRIEPGMRTANAGQPAAAPAATPSTNGSLMSGAQPIPPATSFDSRWSAFQ